MRYVYIGLIVVFTALVLLFKFQNLDTVTVSLFSSSITPPGVRAGRRDRRARHADRRLRSGAAAQLDRRRPRAPLTLFAARARRAAPRRRPPFRSYSTVPTEHPLEQFLGPRSRIASTFIFIAYLLVLFQIIVDLFRDPDLGGGSKVLWIIGLIFVPVLTSLIYILTRGRGMAARQRSEVQRARSDAETYIREVAGNRRRTRSPTRSACSMPAPSTPTSSPA